MIEFCFESYFFSLTGTNLSLKVQSRMEAKMRIKNLKSLFDFFEKFGRVLLFLRYPSLSYVSERIRHDCMPGMTKLAKLGLARWIWRDG